MGFLNEQEDITELAYLMVVENISHVVREEIEDRLRKYLEGTDTLLDAANDLANEEE